MTKKVIKYKYNTTAVLQYSISASKILSTNGDIMEAPAHPREKHHRSRVRFKLN